VILNLRFAIPERERAPETAKADICDGVYGLRYYNPGEGRWLTEDPIGPTGGINLYDYIGNDPTNSVDSFGLCPCDSNKPAQKSTDVPSEWLKTLCGTAAGKQLVADINAGKWNVFEFSDTPPGYKLDSGTMGFGNSWSKPIIINTFGTDAFILTGNIAANSEAQDYGLNNFTVATLIHETVGHSTITKSRTFGAKPRGISPLQYNESMVQAYVDTILPSYGLPAIHPGSTLPDYLRGVPTAGVNMLTGQKTSDYNITVPSTSDQDAVNKYQILRNLATQLTGWDCARINPRPCK
jgi:RHS repeat-associated protein